MAKRKKSTDKGSTDKGSTDKGSTDKGSKTGGNKARSDKSATARSSARHCRSEATKSGATKEEGTKRASPRSSTKKGASGIASGGKTAGAKRSVNKQADTKSPAKPTNSPSKSKKSAESTAKASVTKTPATKVSTVKTKPRSTDRKSRPKAASPDEIAKVSALAARAQAATAGPARSRWSPKRGSQSTDALDDDYGDPLPNPGRKPKKTRLKPQELEEFQEMLLEKRRELIGDVANLQDDAMRKGASGENGASSMPIHLAELGTDTWEQEFTLGLIEKERSVLKEIDEALARIDDRTYGICLVTGKAISKTRLRAQPWAKYCIEYARKRELGLA